MLDSYSEARVVMAPTGDLFITLPIYANQNGALFNSKAIEAITGENLPSNVSIGIYERMGYLLYHPTELFAFYMNSLDLFEDLGEL